MNSTPGVHFAAAMVAAIGPDGVPPANPGLPQVKSPASVNTGRVRDGVVFAFAHASGSCLVVLFDCCNRLCGASGLEPRRNTYAEGMVALFG